MLELLGLDNVWLMLLPEDGVAPKIPPVTVPIVQAKLLGAVAPSGRVNVPQVVAVVVELTAGVG